MGLMMKVKTSYEGCRYITAGKVYNVSNISDNNLSGEILNDKGAEILILLPNQYNEPCAHLGHEGRWEVVK